MMNEKKSVIDKYGAKIFVLTVVFLMIAVGVQLYLVNIDVLSQNVGNLGVWGVFIAFLLFWALAYARTRDNSEKPKQLLK